MHSLPVEQALSFCAVKKKLNREQLEQAVEVAYLIREHIPKAYLNDCAFRYNKDKTISYNMTNYWVWQVPSSPKFSECLLIWAHDTPHPSTNEQSVISSYAYAACGMIGMTFAEILAFTAALRQSTRHRQRIPQPPLAEQFVIWGRLM